MRSLALAAVLAVAAGCALPRLPAKLPGHDRAWIAVLSGALGPPLERVGRHAWIVASIPGETAYRKWEYLGSAFVSTTEDPLRHDELPEVAVHGVSEDSVEVIKERASCLDAFVEVHGREHPPYRLVPGPNSNTFVARAMRACGVHAELPSTAVGRDYLGTVGVAVTEAGTGVQLETFALGVRVGLREGIEFHVVGAAIGVHFWPPGITVPINPGRIGIDLDGHAERPDDRDRGEDSQVLPREYGLVNAWVYARGAYVPHSAKVGGLHGIGTVGVSARALFAARAGYAFGIDIDLGGAAPLGIAYGAHLYPVGLGVAIGPTGWIAAFLGLGTSGITGSVPFALEAPAELRVEADLGTRLRIGARGTLVPAFLGGARRDRSILGFFDEWLVGGFVRIGRTKHVHGATAGGGWFLGVERREILSGAWWSASLGVEMNLGG